MGGDDANASNSLVQGRLGNSGEEGKFKFQQTQHGGPWALEPTTGETGARVEKRRGKEGTFVRLPDLDVSLVTYSMASLSNFPGEGLHSTNLKRWRRACGPCGAAGPALWNEEGL